MSESTDTINSIGKIELPNIDYNEENPHQKNIDSMSKAIPNLTDGLLLLGKVPIDAISLKLIELQKEQSLLLNALKSENVKLSSIKNVDTILENFSKINEYLIKIQVLKKDMSAVQDKLGKINEKAKSLKEKKKQYEISVHERVEKQLQRERDLIVKPSSQTIQTNISNNTKPQQQNTLNSNISL
ncbi:hypothetical protein DLAC_00425 [Tieghemostelium lacteum]|uniref:Biogenesis of lysosome-related organelles complex 1 subunit 6 n=1 Tax=Tieghemostelium lacteum TaxID=361077 RepID=A0A152A9P4_TIELA|nr:hypothetical protein DLAC_00425 [Tieghemostelium lacteum]|eukprot:KYR02943.1 hypothetical protein DLAC_00425 [Tieghemostelium lacteum]